ncbi:hypothetical protein RKD18_007909 [Streptomyces phaeoluteigriseus]
MQALGRGLPAERFAWAAVAFGGDRGQVFKGVWTDRSVLLENCCRSRPVEKTAGFVAGPGTGFPAAAGESSAYAADHVAPGGREGVAGLRERSPGLGARCGVTTEAGAVFSRWDSATRPSDSRTASALGRRAVPVNPWRSERGLLGYPVLADLVCCGFVERSNARFRRVVSQPRREAGGAARGLLRVDPGPSRSEPGNPAREERQRRRERRRGAASDRVGISWRDRVGISLQETQAVTRPVNRDRSLDELARDRWPTPPAGAPASRCCTCLAVSVDRRADGRGHAISGRAERRAAPPLAAGAGGVAGATNGRTARRSPDRLRPRPATEWTRCRPRTRCCGARRRCPASTPLGGAHRPGVDDIGGDDAVHPAGANY